MRAPSWTPGARRGQVANHLLPPSTFATSEKSSPLKTAGFLRGTIEFIGGRGGGRTHTKSELRQILSLVRLPVPPLRLSAPPLYRQADEAQPISSERQPTFCL